MGLCLPPPRQKLAGEIAKINSFTLDRCRRCGQGAWMLVLAALSLWSILPSSGSISKCSDPVSLQALSGDVLLQISPYRSKLFLLPTFIKKHHSAFSFTSTLEGMFSSRNNKATLVDIFSYFLCRGATVEVLSCANRDAHPVERGSAGPHYWRDVVLSPVPRAAHALGCHWGHAILILPCGNILRLQARFPPAPTSCRMLPYLQLGGR